MNNGSAIFFSCRLKSCLHVQARAAEKLPCEDPHAGIAVSKNSATAVHKHASQDLLVSVVHCMHIMHYCVSFGFPAVFVGPSNANMWEHLCDNM